MIAEALAWFALAVIIGTIPLAMYLEWKDGQ